MEHFLLKTNLSITDPNDPKKPVDYNLPTPSPDWLDTEDEEEDLEGVDLQALSSNQNSLPEEMTPELYPNTAESVIYSETLTEGGTSPLFFHPRPGNFISFEVCTDFERERLTRLIQHTDRLCRDLCVKRDSVNEKFVHNQRKMRGNYYKQKAISPPTDLSGITRWAVKTDRLKTKNRADNNRLNVELLNLRRFQTYNSLRLQAVLNGIHYRRNHPDVSFVIFIRTSDVVLMLTQEIGHEHVTSMPTTRRHNKRENLETNHLNFGNATARNSHHIHRIDTDNTPANNSDCKCTVTDLSHPFFNETFAVHHPSTAFEFLNLFHGSSKIILVEKKAHGEKVAVLKNTLLEMYKMFKNTVEQWKSLDFSTANEKLFYVNRLVTNSIKSNEIKIDVLNMIIDEITSKFKDTILWWYKPEKSLQEILKKINQAVDRLL